MFMNTQKLPLNKLKGNNNLMSGFKSKMGLELSIGEQKDTFVSKRGKSKRFELNQLDEEQEEEASSKVFKELIRNKGDDPNNFANENVMSKSNLRKPKQFNFGFPDTESDDEGSPQEEEAVAVVVKKETAFSSS